VRQSVCFGESDTGEKEEETMTPFAKAYTPESEKEILRSDLFKKWEAGNETVRKAFPTINLDHARDMIAKYVEDVCADLIFKNDTYQVTVRELDGNGVHLSIKRNDRKSIHDWRELQQIKN
jgi:hypothetical protein